MRGGARLGRHHEGVAHGRRPLAQAISEYETEMTTCGFFHLSYGSRRDVRESALEIKESLFDQHVGDSGNTDRQGESENLAQERMQHS